MKIVNYVWKSILITKEERLYLLFTFYNIVFTFTFNGKPNITEQTSCVSNLR